MQKVVNCGMRAGTRIETELPEIKVNPGQDGIPPPPNNTRPMTAGRGTLTDRGRAVPYDIGTKARLEPEGEQGSAKTAPAAFRAARSAAA